jgi:hypothetical protein
MHVVPIHMIYPLDPILQERMDNFTDMTQTNKPGVKDLIQDGWTNIMRNLNQEFTVSRCSVVSVVSAV